MNTRYRLTARAEIGFAGIIRYVERSFGTAIALKVVARLEAAFEGLCKHPRTGRRRRDITPDDTIRFWPVGPTLIAYRLRANVVEILFVERGERDWTGLLLGSP